ncbi:unnamed protein product [Ectocarpus sp. 4 AP-2014]
MTSRKKIKSLLLWPCGRRFSLVFFVFICTVPCWGQSPSDDRNSLCTHLVSYGKSRCYHRQRTHNGILVERGEAVPYLGLQVLGRTHPTEHQHLRGADGASC